MNKFTKYCPNVWVAECDEEYEKGEVITLTTKYGKEVDCEVYNFLGEREERYLYSIVRLDESYAERKAEKYRSSSERNATKSDEKWEKSQEGREFLSMAEPIKIGHHSEKRHRALIERNRKRAEQAMELSSKADEQRQKAEYWEKRAKTITLANPESLEYFTFKLEEAEAYHKDLKDHPEKRSHDYSLTYAKKDVNELNKKIKIAKTLWGR